MGSFHELTNKAKTKNQRLWTFYEKRYQQHAIASVGVACVYTCVKREHQLLPLTLVVHNMRPTSNGYLQYFCAVLCLVKSVRIRLS